MIKNYITVDGYKYKLIGEEDVERGSKEVRGTIGEWCSTIHLKGTINGSQANIAVSDDDTADIRGIGWDLNADELREFISFLEDVLDRVEETEEVDDDE